MGQSELDSERGKMSTQENSPHDPCIEDCSDDEEYYYNNNNNECSAANNNNNGDMEDKQQQQHISNIQNHILQFPSQNQWSSSQHNSHSQSLVRIRQCNLRLECREEEEAIITMDEGGRLSLTKYIYKSVSCFNIWVSVWTTATATATNIEIESWHTVQREIVEKCNVLLFLPNTTISFLPPHLHNQIEN